MRAKNMNRTISKTQVLRAMAALLFTAAADAASPGITSTAGTLGTFNLTAQTAYLNQPDGNGVYSWGYGCATGSAPTFLPAAISGAACPTMQVPGPTLIVTEGTTVMVNLTNGLPAAAGNTSILFPDFQVATTGGVTGLLTQEAAPIGCTGTGCNTVTYTFSTTGKPGTHAYYSGTQQDLQIEMGLYGAIVVLPSAVPSNCAAVTVTGGFYGAAYKNVAAPTAETDFRLAHAAYDHPKTCYDREYLFQWSEMDVNIHRQALAQVNLKAGCTAGAVGCSLEVPTEPYHPGYFLINGRSMPDLMDANYGAEYPHQPYNANPHMHPGEQVLIRTIGQGRWQHPFHEHGNHVRILARDGNLILAPDGNNLAGILMFNTDTTPGQAFDGIFYWSGRGLNWDPYAHEPSSSVGDPLAVQPCVPDSNGYYTTASSPAASPTAINYYEWCQDHNKPLEVNPFGDVAGNGPATLPNPNIFTNGAWYGGTPYLGPDASLRGGTQACATTSSAALTCTNLQPSNTQANPANERGFAFMWHSHNEREITTNNVFPGGMLMMMLVDSREFVIDESN
jgi:FtsP/CotA-like multicopper oxidase with cupredoxin domain